VAEPAPQEAAPEPPAPVPAHPGRSPRAHPAHRSASFILSGGAGIGAPSGEWFDGFTAGVAADVTARVRVEDTFFLGVNYRYQKLGVSGGGEGTLYDDLGNPYQVRVGLHLSEYYLMVGRVWENRYRRSLAWYCDVGLGVVAHTLSAEVSTGGASASGSEQESKFGVLLDGGGIVPLGGNLGFNFEGNMRITGSSANSSSYYGYDPYRNMGLLWGLKGGLALMLGR
jgi:hypothetical protein